MIRLDIDYKEMYADIGLKSPLQLMHMLVAKYYRKAEQGIEKAVAEGDFMAMIETGRHAVSQLAKEKPYEPEIIETVLPRHCPEVKALGSIMDVVI